MSARWLHRIAFDNCSREHRIMEKKGIDKRSAGGSKFLASRAPGRKDENETVRQGAHSTERSLD
jgi:hypothetical protein